MVTDFSIKRGARLPSFVCTFAGGSGRSLAGASVTFVMYDPESGLVKVNAAAVIEDATARRVRYDWSSADTDTVALYRADWYVTYGDGLPERFPENAWHAVEVTYAP